MPLDQENRLLSNASPINSEDTLLHLLAEARALENPEVPKMDSATEEAARQVSFIAEIVPQYFDPNAQHHALMNRLIQLSERMVNTQEKYLQARSEYTTPALLNILSLVILLTLFATVDEANGGQALLLISDSLLWMGTAFKFIQAVLNSETQNELKLARSAVSKVNDEFTDLANLLGQYFEITPTQLRQSGIAAFNEIKAIKAAQAKKSKDRAELEASLLRAKSSLNSED